MQIEKITQDLLPSEDLASTKSSSLLSPEQVSVSDMSKLPEAVYPVIGKYLDTPDAASFSQTAKAFTAIKPEKVILYGNDDVAAWQAKLKTIQDNGLLTRVRLLRIENATADQLTALIPCIDFPALEILDLSGCGSELTDASIKAIAQKCTGLTHLDLSQCHELTDSSITEIIKSSKTILYLMEVAAAVFLLPHHSLPYQVNIITKWNVKRLATKLYMKLLRQSYLLLLFSYVE